MNIKQKTPNNHVIPAQAGIHNKHYTIVFYK